MFLRQLFTTGIVLSAIVYVTPVANATLPPEVRKELSELMKELKDVNSLVKKKEVDQAKEIIKKVEDRITELAIPEDEKDRAYSTFKGQLEKTKNLIPVSFEHEVAPILKDNCLRCHGDLVHGVVRGSTWADEAVRCVQCHQGAGHGARR